ncbi:MAG TPA: dihydroorotase [Methylomirabilota bacterium]|nr:dihydroorotase [Methylomirabilota bacterium]
MADTYDLIIRGGVAATPNGIAPADIAVRDGRIAAIGRVAGTAADNLDAKGLHILPGVIDTQVHMREPGLEHKEDLGTGTAAAALGGVTAVFEMPNTKPSTLTAADLADKLARAKGRAWCDVAFFVGAAAENAERLGELERLPGCAGVKIFMGSSTGSLLVAEDRDILQALRSGRRRVAVHAEDEARLRQRYALVRDGADPTMHPVWRDVETAAIATQRLMRLAREAGRRVHVLHVTTAEEMAILATNKDIATVETTPQHLTLVAPDCYERLGTLAQMNPPIRDIRHRDALWQAVGDGVVDCIGSDHAPHTREEKEKPYPQSPSGMPGVQTLLPLLLDHMNAGRLTLERLIDLTSTGPARIYGIAGKGRIAVGYDADLTLVDLGARRTIRAAWIASRCGWTPFDGMTVTGWPAATVVRGHVVMRDDQLVGSPVGQSVRFTETL